VRIEPEISGITLVLRGHFNPAIFVPAWFALHGLLPETLASGADLSIASPHVTAFGVEWLQLQVADDRMSLESTQAPFTRLRDLALRIFREKLPETPLYQLGINRAVHFRVESLAARDRISRILAPAEPWEGSGLELGSNGQQGEVTSITMSQIGLEGRPAEDRINVKVEPSTCIEGNRGVFVEVNDHYTIGDEDLGSSEKLIDILDDNFDLSMSQSAKIVDHVMSLAVTRQSSVGPQERGKFLSSSTSSIHRTMPR